MGKLSAIIRNSSDNGLLFWCPGCDMAHRIQYGAGAGPRWSWNGNADKPTFSPSLLVQWTRWTPPATTQEIRDKIASGEIQQREVHHVCHSFVEDGRFRFLDDCTHSLKGQTVDIPAWPD